MGDERQRVVFVDDDGFVLRALEMAFAGTFDLHSLPPGPNVVAQIKRIDPTLVITDWDLRNRRRDGIWLLGALKRERLRARRVLMTAHALTDLPSQANTVAELLLQKPFGRADLEPVLRGPGRQSRAEDRETLEAASRDRAFLEHLVDTGILEREQLLRAMDRVLVTRVPIGGVAIELGLMTSKQVFEVLREQGRGEKRRRFGEIAIERGYLDRRSLAEVLDTQGTRSTPVLSVLVANKVVAPAAIVGAWRQWSAGVRSSRPTLASVG